MKKYHGRLDIFAETGTEGAVWILMRDGKRGYGAMVDLEKDDHLTVWDAKNKIVFKGKICPDYKIGWKRYPRNPKFGQQVACGFWVHWIQKGWKPDEWGRLFMRMKQEKRLRAELVRKKKNDNKNR